MWYYFGHQSTKYYDKPPRSTVFFTFYTVLPCYRVLFPAIATDRTDRTGVGQCPYSNPGKTRLYHLISCASLSSALNSSSLHQSAIGANALACTKRTVLQYFNNVVNYRATLTSQRQRVTDVVKK